MTDRQFEAIYTSAIDDNDRIYLLIRHVGTQAMPIRTLIRYAIAY